ncbi:hypothetical protein [[Phormidium] sp. ETS-05]|nr:hypothetical protein [[Phormidium] sp. ETS-05]
MTALALVARKNIAKKAPSFITAPNAIFNNKKLLNIAGIKREKNYPESC